MREKESGDKTAEVTVLGEPMVVIVGVEDVNGGRISEKDAG